MYFIFIILGIYMKFTFNDLSLITKEAKKLHKFLKSKGLSSNLSTAQHVVASFYGWKSYNEMASYHNNNKVSRYENSVSGYMNITLANQLEKVALEGRKKLIITKYISDKGVYEEIAASFCDEFLSSKGLINKLFSSENVDVKKLRDIPDKQLARGVMTQIRQYDDRVKVYAELSIPRLTQGGGFAVLDPHVADEIVPVFELLNDGRESYILNTTGSSIGEDNLSSKPLRIHPLAFDSHGRSPISLALGEISSENDDDVIYGNDFEKESSLIILKSLLEHVGGKAQEDDSIEASFINDTVELLHLDNEGGLDSSFDAKLQSYAEKYACPNDAVACLSTNQAYMSFFYLSLSSLSRMVRKFYLSENFYLSFDSYLESLKSDVQGFDNHLFETSFYGSGAFFVVADPNIRHSVFVSKVATLLFRSSIAVTLGASLYRNDMSEGRKAILIDVPHVISRGFSVVCVQSKSIGCDWIVNAPSFEPMGELEYFSLVSNVAVFLLSSLPTDMNDPVVQVTGIYRDSEDMRKLLMEELSVGGNYCERNGKFISAHLSSLTLSGKGWQFSVIDKPKSLT